MAAAGLIVGGVHSHLIDQDGTRVIDFSSQYMCVNVGHQHHRIVDAIHEQAERLCFVDPRYATHPRAELGRLLAEITPNSIQKSIICMSGSDANDHAHQAARLYTGRKSLSPPTGPSMDHYGDAAS